LSILVVCTANVARSPLAQVMLGASLDVEVDSAGTQAREGDTAAVRSQELAAARGLDLACHRSKPLRPEAIEAADLVITMAADHRDHCEILVPDAGPKVFTLRELVRLITASDDHAPAQTQPNTPGTRSPADLATRADQARPTAPRSSWRSEDVHDPIQDPWPKWVRMGATLDELLTSVLAALGREPGWTTPDPDRNASDLDAPRRWWQVRSAR
jgi:protein-tyrosine phosphatase